MNNVPNQQTNQSANQSAEPNHHLDTTGLICPEPIMLLHQKIRRSESGDTIEIIATDPATTRDIPNFCNHLGHTLISHSESNQSEQTPEQAEEEIIYHYLVQKK